MRSYILQVLLDEFCQEQKFMSNLQKSPYTVTLTHNLSLSERPKQDETIMNIVNEMKKKQNQKAKLHKEAEEMVGRKL